MKCTFCVGICPNFGKYLIFVLNSFRQCRSKTPAATGICTAHAIKSPIFLLSPPQIDVTSFIKNCHTDTCNCNLGGDCECLCTSIAAYAHKCCQQGAAIHWRSPLLCGMYLGWPRTRAHLTGISDIFLPSYTNMTEAGVK